MNGLGGVSSASTGSHPKRVLKHQKLNLKIFFLLWLVYYIGLLAPFVCMYCTMFLILPKRAFDCFRF